MLALLMQNMIAFTVYICMKVSSILLILNCILFKGSDQLSVPQTSESRMAKMKKKISSPLIKRRNLSGGKLSIFS